MSKFIARTYCDFGQMDRKDELCSHLTIKTAKRQFSRKARIYHGIHKFRVWTEVLSSGQIICDTNHNHQLIHFSELYNMKKKNQKINVPPNLSFTCPECKKHIIEEVVEDVSLYSNILSLSENGDFEYDLTDQSDGEVSRYQCSNCGYIIVDKNGQNITDCLDLVKWLKSKSKT